MSKLTHKLKCFFLSVLALLCVSAANVYADDTYIKKVEPVIRNEKIYLDTDINIDISSGLRNIAIKGVPLYFTANTEIKEKRWYWSDKVIADEQITWRIAYNALTRQWTVSNGSLSLLETSFNDALSRIEHIRDWSIVGVDSLDDNTQYYGRVKVRLDTSMLARPFQIDALNSSAWTLSTPWENFSFSIKQLTSQK